MNILPKKNWHVRNKDNIEKVRKDEAKAAEEEKERQKRVAIAESEARLNFLRAKSGTFRPNESVASSQHLNLFEEEEIKKHNEDRNVETEHEKKQEKEKYEKKIGLLTYLTSEENNLKAQPWTHTLKVKKKDDGGGNEVDLKRKLENDPMNEINAHCSEKKKSKKKHDKKKKEEKKEEPKTRTIEQLRAERLKREAEERLKAEKLLNGGKEKSEKLVEIDDRKRRYNNQFNPQLSKY